MIFFRHLFRIIKFAGQDLYRNFSLSLMTILVLVLMLLSVNTLVIVKVLADRAINEIKKQIDVSIYFSPEATDDEIKEIREYISSFPEVEQEIYLDKEKVLQAFKENYKFNKNVLDSLSELNENPLGPTLILKTREPQDYKKIIQAISIPEYENIIEAKTFADTEQAIDKIHNISQQVKVFSLFLTGLFSLIAFIIIFNTIRILIYTQRIEITIKRLVGANKLFIQGPYLIESFFFAVFSVILTSVIIYFVNKIIDPYIAIIFNQTNILTDYFRYNIIMLISVQFVSVLLLTTISSWLAVRRYIR